MINDSGIDYANDNNKGTHHYSWKNYIIITQPLYCYHVGNCDIHAKVNLLRKYILFVVQLRHPSL